MGEHHHHHNNLLDLQHAIKDLFRVQPITIENALILLDNALKWKIPELEKKCMEFIEPNVDFLTILKSI